MLEFVSTITSILRSVSFNSCKSSCCSIMHFFRNPPRDSLKALAWNWFNHVNPNTANQDIQIVGFDPRNPEHVGGTLKSMISGCHLQRILQLQSPQSTGKRCAEHAEVPHPPGAAKIVCNDGVQKWLEVLAHVFKENILYSCCLEKWTLFPIDYFRKV